MRLQHGAVRSNGPRAYLPTCLCNNRHNNKGTLRLLQCAPPLPLGVDEVKQHLLSPAHSASTGSSGRAAAAQPPPKSPYVAECSLHSAVSAQSHPSPIKVDGSWRLACPREAGPGSSTRETGSSRLVLERIGRWCGGENDCWRCAAHAAALALPPRLDWHARFPAMMFVRIPLYQGDAL